MTSAGELWEGLSPEEREQVARFCPERRFSRGSTIFAPGDAPDALYIVTSGLVTLSHVSEDGQESILIAAVAYGWRREEHSHAAAEREPLEKAA